MSDSAKSAWKAFLRGVSGPLLVIAALAFFFGGRAMREFAKTDFVFGEMAGIFVAIVFGGLGLWAKSAGEEDETEDEV